MELHPSQREAILHGEGPAFVLAGPGSGKTMVLTERICHLIQDLFVPPERILVMTFTRAAAMEMEQRFLKRYEGGVGVSFGTFHSAFFRILKESSSERLHIITGQKQTDLLKGILKEQRREQLLERDFLKEILREIGKVKTAERGLDFSASALLPPEQFEQVYRSYEAYRREEGLLDFNDILLQCKRLLLSRKDICRYWRGRFDFFLVDEFQDASEIQYELVRLLAEPNNNLFLVGDDDQAIYGFRGAAPDLMARAARELPGCRRMYLNVNYRSTDAVLEGAARLISHNQKRLPKKIFGTGQKGPAVTFQEYDDEKEQARETAKLVKGLKKGERAAVLFRTNRLMKPFAEAFLKMGLSFQMKEPLAALEEYWAIEDILAYVRLGSGGRARKDFLRILNKPFRGLSREALRGYDLSPEAAEKMEAFQKQLAMLQSLPPFGQIQFLRKGMGYEDYIKENCRQKREDASEVLFRLDELQRECIPYRTGEEWLSFREKERRRLEEKMKSPLPGDVALLTIHGAKGLEFDTVILPDWNQGILPHKHAASKEETEEERRLAYVAVTRAKKGLFISWVKRRYGKEQKPSPFVKEMGFLYEGKSYVK